MKGVFPMTKTVRKAIETLQTLNPYEKETPEREEAFIALWNAMRTLRKLDIISAEEWDAIFETEHKMYINAE